MLGAALQVFMELAPWLLLAAVVAGLLHVLIPPNWFRRHLTGRSGVFKAVLAGVPMPLCSCGVIPVGLGLKKEGASDGAVVGFLISTPQTGVDSILVAASLLGMPFALFKVAASMITGLIRGWLANATEESEQKPARLPDVSAAKEIGRLRAFIEHSLTLIRSIWAWIVVGVLVSALITSLVPEDSLANLAGFGGLPAMLITLLISLPLYVCATASVPIAAALVISGLPPGAALVFLMAGPATNVATIGAVYRTLGKRSLGIYLVTVRRGG